MASILSKLRNPRIALLSGSTRVGSFNTHLIVAAEQVAQAAGAETNVISLQDFPLPVYNQDDEAVSGLPQAAKDLKEALGKADAWVVASPEYNGFPSPLLLNAYTWCSRGDDETMYTTLRGKTACLLSASPGGLGGMRNHNPHRQILTNLGVHVLPDAVAIGGAFKAFDESGRLVDDKQQSMLETAIQALFLNSREL